MTKNEILLEIGTSLLLGIKAARLIQSLGTKRASPYVRLWRAPP